MRSHAPDDVQPRVTARIENKNKDKDIACHCNLTQSNSLHEQFPSQKTCKNTRIPQKQKKGQMKFFLLKTIDRKTI
jgi:hypothetical protein